MREKSANRVVGRDFLIIARSMCKTKRRITPWLHIYFYIRVGLARVRWQNFTSVYG